MAALVGPSLAHWLLPGAFFGLVMAVTFTAMSALSLRTVRREWPVVGDAVARRRLLDEAARLKLRPSVEDGNYLWLRPRGFRLKPLCTTVEAWLTPEAV